MRGEQTPKSSWQSATHHMDREYFPQFDTSDLLSSIELHLRVPKVNQGFHDVNLTSTLLYDYLQIQVHEDARPSFLARA